ncbi:MAG: efflux RND transporter periplasmic adaptor subunit [Acidobacteriota bacterium]
MPASISNFVFRLGLAAVLLLAWACGEEVEAPEPVIRPVRTHVVETSGGGDRAAYAGVAKAGIESRMSFRVGGTVELVGVKVGDRVRRGTVLARLDATDFELSVEQSEASLAQARASLRQAEADYGRTRALYENNNASRAELDAGRAAAESAAAQVKAAAKALEQARQQVRYTVLVSPMNGAVGTVDVEVNENVSGGQALFRLTADTSPEVEIRVPEVLIPQIEAGQTADVAFDAFPERLFHGTVTEVGVTSSGSSTFPVTLRIDDDNAAIRSGMAAEVGLRVRHDGQPLGSPAIHVPLVAVGEDQNGSFVMVLEAGTGDTATVRRRPVEVGELGENGVRILSGVEAGERVVTAGVRRLTDGMTVRSIGTGEAP